MSCTTLSSSGRTVDSPKCVVDMEREMVEAMVVVIVVVDEGGEANGLRGGGGGVLHPLCAI